MQLRQRAFTTAITVAIAAGGGVAAAATEPAAAATPQYYLAMGDSLAANVGASPSSNGYVNRVFQHEATRFPGLTLNNISCGGATTASILNGSNCGRPTTQIVAAETFLRANRGKVAFVTIDIGGNDASGCITGAGVNQTCANNAVASITTNLTAILNRLKAAYPGIRVYGMNYYTPQLAYWLQGSSGQQVAHTSVPAAETFNAMLTQLYATAGFPTADVATAFDNSNEALTGTYNATPVPQNVANLCNWTKQCSNNDVHANNTGHAKIADAFTAQIDAVQTTPAITTSSLPTAHIATPYSVTLAASGGTPPYKWKRIGKLPKGLKLAPKTGLISGTPKKTAVTTSFQVRVTDKSKPKLTSTKTFTITVG